MPVFSPDGCWDRVQYLPKDFAAATDPHPLFPDSTPVIFHRAAGVYCSSEESSLSGKMT